MAYKNQNVAYCSSAKYSAVTAWAANTAKTVGNLVRQTAPALNNERIWLCYVGGTTNATTEPTWTVNRGDKIATDGSVSWIEVTGLPAINGDVASTPNWTNGAKSSNVSLGHIIKDVAGTHYFVCTVNGNAGTGAEPTWNTAALGNTTVDSGVTWVYIGLTASAFPAWGGPHARLARALNTNWMDSAATALQFCYVGHDHAETQSTAGISFPSHGTINPSNGQPLSIICVSTAGSLPPVTADLATTATVTATGANNIQVGSGTYRYCYGINFVAGNSANISLSFNGDSGDRYYENCSFSLPSGSGSGAQIQFSGTGIQRFKGSTFTFSNAGHTFTGSGYGEFDNCIFNGTAPTVNGLLLNASGGRHTFRNCDFSAWTNMVLHSGNNTGAAIHQFRDCLMPSGYTIGDVSTNSTVNGTDQIILSRCSVSGGGATPWQYAQNDQVANLTADAVVARASGAQDGGTAISWKGVTKITCMGTNASDMRPPVIAEWNSRTGQNVTVTVYGVYNSGSLPTNDTCFIDVDYLGTSGSALGVRKSSKVTDYLATTAPSNVSADTSDWTAGTVAARQNSHTYSVGDVIKVASNPGRIFFCTASSGANASSEPGGYASAVDGGVVTDGSATFRAGVRFKMSVVLTSPQPQIVGNVYCQIKFSVPSVTIYFDPLLALS